MAWVTVATAAYTAISGEIGARGEQKMGRLRKKSADHDAAMEMAYALESAHALRRQGLALVGETQSAYASAGVLVNQDTPGRMVDSINQDIEHDAGQVILQSARRANAIRAGGSIAGIEANSRADAMRTEGYANAFQYGYQAYGKAKTAGWFTRKQSVDGGATTISQSAADARNNRLRGRYSQPIATSITGIN